MRHRKITLLLRLATGNLQQGTGDIGPIHERVSVLGLLICREPHRGNVDDELGGHRVLLGHPVKQGIHSSLGDIQSHDVTIPLSRRMTDGEAVAESVFEDTLSVAERDPRKGLGDSIDRHGLWLRKHVGTFEQSPSRGWLENGLVARFLLQWFTSGN